MDLTAIVHNPVFVFVTGALGGLCGTLLKGRVDIWTSDVKRRQDSVTHFFQQVELLAPSYYLMINHASLLSWRLDSYLRFKREKMALLESDELAYKLLAQTVETTAAEALFEAGKLYRVITDRFFIEGGDYVVPDPWANEALNGLHDKMMELLTFDANVLLKHLCAKTERQEFLEHLHSPETDLDYQDLRKQYALYTDWVGKHDKEVRLLAETARAYSDLFRQEITLLYKVVWSGETNDPLKAKEVNATGNGLSAGTQDLIKEAARQKDLFEERLATAQKAGATATMADAFLSVGWRYYEARQWDLALGEFKKAIEVCPDSAAAHNSLGNAYTNKQDFEAAEQAYKEAAQKDGRNPVFKHNEAKMQARRGKVEHLTQAVELFKEAIRLGAAMDAPDDAQQALRYNDLAGTLASLERWDESFAAYGEAIFLQPSEPVLYGNLASTYQDKYLSTSDAGALDGAIGEYTMAVSLSVGDAAAAYERDKAGTYQKAARWKESEDAYRSAIEHFSNDTDKAETHYQSGRMYAEQKDWSRAAEAHAQALELGKYESSLYAVNLIDAIHESGSKFPPDLTAKAIDTCHTAIQQHPSELVHRGRLAHIYYVLADDPRFLEERDKIVRLATLRLAPNGDVTKKEMAGYYNQLGYAYRRLEIKDMAIDYYQRAIALDPAPEYQKNLGLLLQSLSRYDEARVILEPASKGLPKDINLMLSLAEVTAYGSNHDLASAIELCRAATRLEPANSTSHFFLGLLLIYAGSFVEGLAEYRKALDLKTTGAKERTDWLQKGIRAYNSAIESDLNVVETHYGSAQMYSWLGDYAKAEEGFCKAQELVGDHHLNSISILNSLAQLYYQRDDYERAKTAWEEARDIGSKLSAEERKLLPTAPLGRIDLEQITNNLGTAYDAAGEKDKALECYQNAALNSPKTFVAHFNLARGLYQQGRFDRALSQFQETLRLSPPPESYFRTVYYIGNCYFRLACTDLAFEKWEEVTGSGVYSAQALYNLGVWYWSKQRDEEAGKRWESALKASPTLFEAEFNLGVLRMKLDDGPGAIGHWQRIAAEPGFESLKETILAVERGEKPVLQIRDIREF